MKDDAERLDPRVGVFGTAEHPGPSFSYTVGRAGRGRPELTLLVA